jgi:hypothetical protein
MARPAPCPHAWRRPGPARPAPDHLALFLCSASRLLLPSDSGSLKKENSKRLDESP